MMVVQSQLMARTLALGLDQADSTIAIVESHFVEQAVLGSVATASVVMVTGPCFMFN